jgi:hypothetical protein
MKENGSFHFASATKNTCLQTLHIMRTKQTNILGHQTVMTHYLHEFAFEGQKF